MPNKVPETKQLGATTVTTTMREKNTAQHSTTVVVVRLFVVAGWIGIASFSRLALFVFGSETSSWQAYGTNLGVE